MSIYLYIFLSIYLAVICPSISVSFVYLSRNIRLLPIYQFYFRCLLLFTGVCLSVYLYIYVTVICPSISVAVVYLSRSSEIIFYVYVFLQVSTCLSIFLSIYVSVICPSISVSVVYLSRSSAIIKLKREERPLSCLTAIKIQFN